MEGFLDKWARLGLRQEGGERAFKGGSSKAKPLFHSVS